MSQKLTDNKNRPALPTGLLPSPTPDPRTFLVSWPRPRSQGLRLRAPLPAHTQAHAYTHVQTRVGARSLSLAGTVVGHSHPQNLHTQPFPSRRMGARGSSRRKGEREAGKGLWKVLPGKLVGPALQPRQHEERPESGLWDNNALPPEALCHPPRDVTHCGHRTFPSSWRTAVTSARGLHIDHQT